MQAVSNSVLDARTLPGLLGSTTCGDTARLVPWTASLVDHGLWLSALTSGRPWTVTECVDGWTWGCQPPPLTWSASWISSVGWLGALAQKKLQFNLPANQLCNGDFKMFNDEENGYTEIFLFIYIASSDHQETFFHHPRQRQNQGILPRFQFHTL